MIHFRDNHDVAMISNLNFGVDIRGRPFWGIYVDQQKLVHMRPPDGEGSKRWPEGMAQWAKVSLVAIQKMIKDEFQAENWMAATEASG